MKKMGFLLICACNYVFAYSATAVDNQQNHQIHTTQELPSVQQISQKLPSVIDEDYLINHPLIFTQILNDAIAQNNLELIDLLLPLYDKLPQKDMILANFAHALLSYANKDYSSAISHYQKILSTDNNLHPVRLRLLQALIDNQQIKSAHYEINTLKHANLPAPIDEFIDSHLENLHNLNQPTFTINARFIHSNNVNDAPAITKMGNWQFDEPVSATGIGYFVQAGLPLHYWDNIHISPTVKLRGKSYDKSKYNDQNREFSIKFTHQDAKKSSSISPYITQRYFAGKPYSRTDGVHLDHTTLLNWSFFNQMPIYGNFYLNISQISHDERTHLDGKNLVIGTTFSNQYGYMGMSSTNHKTAQKNDSYKQYGLYLGTQKNLKQLSISLDAGLNHRLYQGKDFFGIQRVDKTYFAETALWHKGLSYKGFAPSVHFRLERKDSNHFYYDNTDRQAFIEINRRF